MNEKVSRPVRLAGESTVRLEDVAAAAGVSLITASRCVSNPGRVSTKTREHVLRVAEQLGYIPNRLASSLASSKSRVVGAVIPTMLNPVHSVVLQAAMEILAPAGYQVLLGTSHYLARTELDLVRTFLGHRVDGLLLTGRDHASECSALLRRAGVPTVEMFEHIQDPIDVGVGTSNFEAGHSLAQYLISRGRRNLAFVGHTDFEDSRINGRQEGLIAAARDNGLDQPRVFSVSSQPGSGTGGEIVGTILRETPETDAVVFAGHQLAVGAIRYALDVGIEVPGRLAIAGFGDSPVAQWIKPALTTIKFPLEDMGREAGKALLQRLSGKDPGARTVRLGFEILSRESA
ncbi:LacI family DNA-binding transcriptional regulator [Chelativorans sp.]|uniref:LacI family DNA-binding transcriptional regulator n=1 Tax=Chelativorans sp. TaxID=2203393 RepID=UPI0028114023|nr:LacI family DNA-binding transcriptional regulator [Chelativorans sp.]